MSPGIALLDEALVLARQEKNALEKGEYEQAISMAQRRGELTGRAWDFFDHAEHEPYRKRLVELSDLQEQLTVMASNARNSVRQSMNRSKMERRRMNGYHRAVGQALQ